MATIPVTRIEYIEVSDNLINLIKDLAYNGRHKQSNEVTWVKVCIIKHVRRELNLGLKESKDIFDSIWNSAFTPADHSIPIRTPSLGELLRSKLDKDKGE